MGIYLGIDGGGSKTAVVLIDEASVELGRGYGGPCNIAQYRDDTPRRSVGDAWRGACEAADLNPNTTHCAALCAGVAGYSAEAQRADFLRMLKDEITAGAYHVEPDYVVAYWGASHGKPGIAVIAGTGAVSYGRNEQGETYREDGLGYLLGDRGSGFNLGLRVLRHTLNCLATGKLDTLSEVVLEQIGSRSQNAVIQWLYGDFSTARVAALAPVVGRLADEGDPAARAHLTEMARRLRHAARAVRHKLWLPRDAPVYPLGGLWQVSPFLRAEFEEPSWRGDGTHTVEAEPLPGGRFPLATPLSDPAYGAALVAKQRKEE